MCFFLDSDVSCERRERRPCRGKIALSGTLGTRHHVAEYVIVQVASMAGLAHSVFLVSPFIVHTSIRTFILNILSLCATVAWNFVLWGKPRHMLPTLGGFVLCSGCGICGRCVE